MRVRYTPNARDCIAETRAILNSKKSNSYVNEISFESANNWGVFFDVPLRQ
jgi:hypothetical protein